MGITRKEVLRIFGAGAGAAAAGRWGLTAGATPVTAAEAAGATVVTRDIAVIGGGATGTYAAIRLRDEGRSVAVIEQQDRLGGHTHTYTDPATGAHVDIGVVVWHDLPLVRDWFARFDVPLEKANFDIPGQESLAVDYRTGKPVTGWTPPDPSAGLAAYAEQLARYPYLEAGFDLPDPVPADLLLPFGEFVRKYNVDSAVNMIFNFGQGLGDLLRQPTLYVFKNFGLDILRNLQVGFLTTSRHDNSELYRKARAELGEDALLCSTVVAADRDAAGHANLLVRGPSGIRLIRARKLLMTIPPKLDNLRGFDVDRTERRLFGQFRNSGYYTGVLRGTGIPDNLSIDNIAQHTPYHLPPLPGVYSISPTGVPGLHNVKYGSPGSLPAHHVKADILASIRRMRAAGTIDGSGRPEFAVFASHTPFELTVPTSAIAAGFYRELSALQGHNSTFWTGAAFHTHDSSLLWQFTESLLPRLTA
ncbi:NAD(P)/FAD-dependent oxidoreductase [Mangrovihabitans endophyticus]|uniref:Monoamine oxidase n=1 Tax=Mangrovihabitans endophyticus TaxID=1751298 RepID=A0A8J3C1Y9_9ACTN|nr:NAD(P)/FAD-dependent oxidoreductase [Mangrovihabitans endophyticus]GGK97999.1 hypothetical protein GCM10012284_35320 [Mangrovihabitans endophyticus]